MYCHSLPLRCFTRRDLPSLLCAITHRVYNEMLSPSCSIACHLDTSTAFDEMESLWIDIPHFIINKSILRSLGFAF